MIFTDHPLFVDYRVLLPRNFILSRIPTFVCVNSTIDARAIAFHRLSHVRTSALQQYGVGNLVLTFLHLFSRSRVFGFTSSSKDGNKRLFHARLLEYRAAPRRSKKEASTTLDKGDEAAGGTVATLRKREE